MANWKHKDIWKHEGRNFMVEVSRHDGPLTDGEVSNNWCTYLYVYPNHRMFQFFKPDEPMYEQPSFAVHSYVSYFKVHRDNAGKICSYQIGWDYQHAGDCYEHVATKDRAYRMFGDAEQLIAQAEEADQDEPTTHGANGNG